MSFQLLRLAASNIRNEKRRSWLTVIGIFIGIAAVVGLVSLGQGLERSIIGEFESIGADKVQIVSQDLADDDVAVVERADGVDIAGGYLQLSRPIEYRRETAFGLVVGVPTGDGLELIRDVSSVRVVKGRHLRHTDRTNIVITQTIAEQTFDREIGLRDTITVNEQDFRVVGIVEPSGPQFENWVVMPRDQMRGL
jgi:putative ABC transport system permease protein